MEIYDYSLDRETRISHIKILSRNVNTLMLEDNSFDRNLALNQDTDEHC